MTHNDATPDADRTAPTAVGARRADCDQRTPAASDPEMGDATTLEPITSFFGEHRFLSNFFPAPVVLDGEAYPTVEHAYQAAKTDDPQVRAAIRACPRPGGAKRAGAGVARPADWDERGVRVMADLLAQKFAVEPLRSMLLATGARLLVEGNRWGDRFWGVDGTGSNHLGNLLMAERMRLQGLPLPILAVDLEGTVVSNAMSLFVRPGAAALLEWARTRFEHVVVYTAVSEERARQALVRVVAEGDLPRWCASMPVLTMRGPCKDLTRLAPLDDPVYLVDDQEDLVCPGQHDHWLPVPMWERPYDPADAGLAPVRDRLESAVTEWTAEKLGPSLPTV